MKPESELLMSPVNLLENLIRRESVTPKDAGCQTLMMNYLKELGFKVKTYNKEGVCNFWAELGDGAPVVCFAGHTDVVPTGPLDDWKTPPFEPHIDSDYLLGRGAADMKGSLAAMLVATRAFVKKTPKFSGRLAYLITSDEEGPAIHGTDYVVNQLMAEGKSLDMCIIGEPTSHKSLGDVIKNGRRGSLSANLRILGKQGHIAYPHLAENAIHQGAQAIQSLTEYPWDQGNAFFPPTSLQVSNIKGGTGAGNVIPGHVDIQLNFRFSSEVTAEYLKKQVSQLLGEQGIRFEVEWRLFGNPFLTEKGPLIEAATAAIEEIMGHTPELSTSGGTSDGRYIARMGAQILELGPVNATIHQANESVRISDINNLALCYERMLDQLLVRDPNY